MLSYSQILVVCRIELFHQMFNWFEKLANINIKGKGGGHPGHLPGSATAQKCRTKYTEKTHI